MNIGIEITFNHTNNSSTTQDVPWENPQNNEDEKPIIFSEYDRQIAENDFYTITNFPIRENTKQQRIIINCMNFPCALHINNKQ